MPKKSTLDVKAILQAEKADALAAMRSSKLSSEREKAMNYYLGNMTVDMPALEGRSKAVSTDVSDTVHGLMPSFMEIFTSGDEVVKFEPIGPEDTAAAEQETDYVNHVFMQQNPGSMILHDMMFDALVSKMGIVKVYWKEEENEERETFLDLDDDQYAILLADDNIEVVEHSIKDAPGDPIDDEPEGDEGYARA